MNSTFDRKYLAALLLALLTLSALAVAGWQTTSQLRSNTEMVRHSHETTRQIDRIHGALLELETSQRGYLLTREDGDLASYRAAQARLPAEMEALLRLLKPHPEQGAALQHLTTLVEAKRSMLAHAIAQPNLDTAKSERGAPPLMDEIRAVLERMHDTESRGLALAEAATEAAVRQNVRIGAGVIGVGALMLLVVCVLMRREQMAHQRAERAEAERRDWLEHEVDRRTAELRESSQALALSEARLRGVFDSANDAILTIDESQHIVMANPAASWMLGLPHDELLGAALDRFVPTTSRERHRALIEDFGRSSPRVRRMGAQREVTALRADGTAFPIEAAISHLQTGGQQLYTVILRDVTERKRADEALRASEARLRQVLMFLPEAVLVHSGGRVGFVNEAALRLFDADESSLLGRTLLELIHPHSVESVRQRIAALHGGAPHSPLEEVTVRRFDGAARDVQATSVRIELHGEISVLVLMRDVTEVKQAQIELQRSEARFREVLMGFPEPVFIRTHNHISFVNRAAQGLFGVAECELIGRSPLDFCHHDSKELMHAHIQATQRREGAASDVPLARATVQRADGTSRDVEVSAAPIAFGGKVSVIVMLRDVSELRRMETDLARSHSDLQRLVSQQDRVQEEERKRIARELHDDLQQKLAAIALNVSAASAQLRRDPQRAAVALAAADEQASSAIESTRRIVNDLRPQMLDDLGLMAALEALCEHFSQASGLTCSVHAPAQARERVASVAPHLATCLYRVAQEALNNVVKHTRASDVRIELDADGAHSLTLRVLDNGSGMSAGARRKPGSFGLLGMNERLRMLGGALRVHSTPGEGTTVEARLPCGAETVVA